MNQDAWKLIRRTIYIYIYNFWKEDISSKKLSLREQIQSTMGIVQQQVWGV